MDDWPSLASELSRKALTCLDKAVSDDELSEADAGLIALYLYDVTEGLVPRSVSNTILAVLKEIRA